MSTDLCNMKISKIQQAAISVKANLRIVGARFIGRLVSKEIAQQAAFLQEVVR